MKVNSIVILVLLSLLYMQRLAAQNVTGDNGNGTYTNPLISADFPDPDVIRVGDTYHMFTTTTFIFL